MSATLAPSPARRASAPPAPRRRTRILALPEARWALASTVAFLLAFPLGIFYFVFLFASSMFYPIDPLPAAFRVVALANPITWHVDVMRFATIGLGDPRQIALEAAGFVAFTLASFAGALYVLRRQG